MFQFTILFSKMYLLMLSFIMLLFASGVFSSLAAFASFDGNNAALATSAAIMAWNPHYWLTKRSPRRHEVLLPAGIGAVIAALPIRLPLLFPLEAQKILPSWYFSRQDVLEEAAQTSLGVWMKDSALLVGFYFISLLIVFVSLVAVAKRVLQKGASQENSESGQ